MNKIDIYNKSLDGLLNYIRNHPGVESNLYGISKTDDYKLNVEHCLKWYIDNCPDEKVNNLDSFKKWIGINAKSSNLTKEDCIKLIYKKQKEYCRPLMYDDFRNPKYGDVSLYMIRKYWGTINKMKEELGLIINQENMIEKSLNSEEYEIQYKMLINYLNNENYKYITQRELVEILKDLDLCVLSSMDKYTHKYKNLSLINRIKSDGFNIGNRGCGSHIQFDDGEETDSYFEYLFSLNLRRLGLVYGKDYFRNIKYYDIDKSVNRTMTCDYMLVLKEEKYYIEIAGYLAQYKSNYITNTSIKFKNREKYRLRLQYKKEIFESNNVNYFILFPCDLTEDNIEQIVNNPTKQLKTDIELFIQNNIDWKEVKKNNKLDYSNKNIFTYKRKGA